MEKKDKKKAETIKGIREKIKELDELDDNFKSLKREWDRIEREEKKLAATPLEKTPQKPAARSQEERKGLFGAVKGLFNVNTQSKAEKAVKQKTKPPDKSTATIKEKKEFRTPPQQTKKPPIKSAEKKPEETRTQPPEKKEGVKERKPLPVKTMSKYEILRKLRGEPITKNLGGNEEKKDKSVEEEGKPVNEIKDGVDKLEWIEEDIPDLGRMEPEQVMKMLREQIGKKERADLEGITKVREEAEGGKPQTEEKHQKKEEKPKKKDKISKKDKLNSILRNMELKADGIQGSAIVTRDGLIVASRLPRGVDLNAFGGFSASFFGATETAVYELKKVRLYDAYIESDEGKVIAVEGGEYVFLVTMVKLDANTGLVLMCMKRAAKEIMKIMES